MLRLANEFAEAGLTGPIPEYSEVQNLPYLDACVQEASRLHPPFCLPFERVVPIKGITVCGKFLQGGTVVGCSPYVVNRHRPTFGEDVEEWRPERWLLRGEEDRRKLESSMMTVSPLIPKGFEYLNNTWLLTHISMVLGGAYVSENISHFLN